MSARPINFRSYEVRTGNIDGARADFEQMIALLVRASTPGVRRVQADPGDWGIDCFVGNLGGVTVVWQSKYFIDGVGESQKKAIREALSSLMMNAGDSPQKNLGSGTADEAEFQDARIVAGFHDHIHRWLAGAGRGARSSSSTTHHRLPPKPMWSSGTRGTRPSRHTA